MSPHCITGLDLGSDEVKLVLAEEHEGRLVPRLFLREPSTGVRRGGVAEPNELGLTIARMMAEATRVNKDAGRTVYVGIGTTQIAAQPSRGIVAVSRADGEIGPDDIDRAVKASQAINLEKNRTLLHNVVREFIVDGTADVVDPLGLTGHRLEVSSIVIDAFAMQVKNTLRAAELGGARVSGMVLNSLASARAALTKRRKQLGSAVVDLGAETTCISAWEDGKLVGVAHLPIGGATLTHDLAIGLTVPVAVAERIKREHGSADAKSAPARDTVDLATYTSDVGGKVTKRFIADIIEARLAELFEMVGGELERWGCSGKLAEGVVLVGGGARLPGIADVARRELKLSVEVARDLGESWTLETAHLASELRDPDYATALGLALWGVTTDEDGPAKRGFSSGFLKGGPKGLLRWFLP